MALPSFFNVRAWQVRITQILGFSAPIIFLMAVPCQAEMTIASSSEIKSMEVHMIAPKLNKLNVELKRLHQFIENNNDE